MSEKFQADYPNSHYLSNLNTLNQANNTVSLNRLPTLGEILSNKTKSPVDLFNFYLFMKEIEGKVDYLDFWFDLINHLNLCKHYVKGLRESIIRHNESPMLNRNSGTSQVRNSIPVSEKSKHKSLSSSILLDLIINDHILEENDSNRLSQFLRGDINISSLDDKTKQKIEKYNQDELKRLSDQEYRRMSDADYRRASDHSIAEHMSLVDNQYEIGEARTSNFLSSPKHIQLDSPTNQYVPPPNNPNAQYSPNPNTQYASVPNSPNTQYVPPPNNPQYRNSPSQINSSVLEKLIRDSQSSENNSFITRNNLKESSHNLLLKYFVEDSEKNLNLPTDLNQFIIRSIEIDGRDDPDVFNSVKIYIFNKIENDHLPRFLNFIAIRNINKSTNTRFIVGNIFLLIAFWIAFVLIFLNYPKSYRVPIIIPFFIASYCLVSIGYLIDPILCWFKLSESFVANKYFIRIKEPFIYKLLLKRSLWVLFLIVLFTAVFTILFSLVPGHRL